MADAATLTFAFMRAHPADAARVLESATVPQVVELFVGVPARIGGAVFAELPPRTAAKVLLAMPEERAIDILAQIGSQPAVAVLRHIEEPHRGQLIAGLPTAAALAAKLLVQFVDDSVGSHVDPSVIATASSMRVGEALERVRHADMPVDRLFIVDDQRRLLGWIALDALLRAPSEAKLDTLVREVPARLAAHTPLSGARSHPGWQVSSALPVVDRGNRLVGVITRDALERALQRTTAPDTEAPVENSLTAVLVRGCWLGMSGIIEAVAASLPAARPISGISNER
jgi:Mg/Co/Ni transporter MgtE